jgi:hypothetical protein
LREEVAGLLAMEDADQACELLSERLSSERHPERWLKGKRIGRYTVQRLLAQGGMGRVFVASQENPHRTVALKLLRPGIITPAILRRFDFEVELLGRLQHANIAHIYEAGVLDEDGETLPFFAMEYIQEGRTLRDYAAAKRLSVAERLQLFCQVCAGVHYGHQRGVIHRDLKPDNLLVNGEGQVKIIDFGVARATDSDITTTTLHTQAGELLGTLQYMSPEQCDGDPRDLDVRSDVYSLGVVLYELLCGRPPYDLSHLSLTAAARRIREQEPELLHLADREGQRNLQAIVHRALAKDREDRYQSAAELALDLESHLAGDPIQAQSPSLFHRLGRFIGRHPVLTTAVAVGVLVALLTLSGGLWLGYWAFQQPGTIQVAENGTKARVYSRGGILLHEWEAALTGFRNSAVVDRPSELGGGRLLLLAATRDSRLDASPGGVCLYEANELEWPLWTSEAVPLSLPPSVPVRQEASFSIDFCRVADVLSEAPGKEVIVLERSMPYSQTAIRVFDLAGQLRYQAWHDGKIASCLPLEPHGLVAFCAVNSEWRWDERGVALTYSQHPTVVFVLDIVDGHIEEIDFVVQNGKHLDPTLHWYRWLGPTEHLDSLGKHIEAVSSQYARRAGHHFKLLIRRKSDRESLMSFTFDPQGQELERTSSDEYKKWQSSGKAPALEMFQLLEVGQLPPRQIVQSPSGGR